MNTSIRIVKMPLCLIKGTDHSAQIIIFFKLYLFDQNQTKLDKKQKSDTTSGCLDIRIENL